jgi:hypothetical protein
LSSKPTCASTTSHAFFVASRSASQCSSAELNDAFAESTPANESRWLYYDLGDPSPADLTAALAARGYSAAEAAANAGEDHPDLLQPGDLAVSPDIQEQLIAAGVKPKEFIRVKFKDGTTRRARWMDITATDEQAAKMGIKPLRGRWDFFTPDGKESRDGMPVISFSRIASPK